MNEKIKTLASKAGWGATSNPYHRQAFDISMFAQLIVQECLACCDDVAREYDDQEVYAGWIATAIKEKFKIER